jgi:hypothetical protein
VDTARSLPTTQRCNFGAVAHAYICIYVFSPFYKY